MVGDAASSTDFGLGRPVEGGNRREAAGTAVSGTARVHRTMRDGRMILASVDDESVVVLARVSFERPVLAQGSGV